MDGLGKRYIIRNPRRTQKLVFFGDTHIKFQDDTVLSILEQFCKDFKPDMVIHLGDLMTCDQVSKYPNEGGTDLKWEFQRAEEILDRFKVKVFFEGNHEERLRRIGLVKPDLRSILSPYENLHIEKRKIIYIPYVNAPEQGTANFGYLTALHGWWTNKNAATSHAQTYGCCVFGHTHRIQTHQPLHAFSGNTGFNIGCTCRLDLPWQKSRPPAGWQQAFGYARIYPNNHFTLDTARLIGDIFTIDGKRYERKRKFRWQTPDPPKADRQNYEPPRT